jgi:uncharacterized membrane-anchored protein YhcB (DUF1043 family)
MHDLPLCNYLQIAAADGRNQLESAKRELHQFLRQCADLMEKLSQR